MKYIYTLFIFVSLFFVSTSFKNTDNNVNTTATEETEKLEWHTDFTKANELALKTGKPIFAFFTGSDWCGWCKRLQKAVFAKPEFVAWANKNVTLLELDFPRRTQLPDNLKKQNQELAGVFKVSGYPTVWLFDTKKNTETNQIQIIAYGTLGYPRAKSGEEAKTFIATANGILANKK